MILKNRTIFLISEILELELYRDPKYLQNFIESLPEELIERIELTNEVRNLAERYITENVVERTSLIDCQHIAFATLYKADVLVSWNFKHIVNHGRIRGYNSINFREGYQMTEIRTPKEIFCYEDNNG